jgi:hypothetical protein
MPFVMRHICDYAGIQRFVIVIPPKRGAIELKGIAHTGI